MLSGSSDKELLDHRLESEVPKGCPAQRDILEKEFTTVIFFLKFCTNDDRHNDFYLYISLLCLST